jgi:hypothetical protein
MSDQLNHDKTIAKIQHFAEVLNQTQRDKESLLITIDRESCEKERLKDQILLCHEMLKEYYQIFDDILYK